MDGLVGFMLSITACNANSHQTDLGNAVAQESEYAADAAEEVADRAGEAATKDLEIYNAWFHWDGFRLYRVLNVPCGAYFSTCIEFVAKKKILIQRGDDILARVIAYSLGIALNETAGIQLAVFICKTQSSSEPNPGQK